jgi:hypothetical protein
MCSQARSRPAGEPPSARGPAGELLSARRSHWMVITPLRESHSARINVSTLPKDPRRLSRLGDPSKLTAGGSHWLDDPSRGGGARFVGPGVAGPAAMRALTLGLAPSGMRALHGWDHPPVASHAVNALKDQTVGGVPSLTPWIVTILGRRPVPPRPRGLREPPACGCSPARQSGRRPPPDHGGKQGARGAVPRV